jgi:hypothetical protein
MMSDNEWMRRLTARNAQSSLSRFSLPEDMMKPWIARCGGATADAHG